MNGFGFCIKRDDDIKWDLLYRYLVQQASSLGSSLVHFLQAQFCQEVILAQGLHYLLPIGDDSVFINWYFHTAFASAKPLELYWFYSEASTCKCRHNFLPCGSANTYTCTLPHGEVPWSGIAVTCILYICTCISQCKCLCQYIALMMPTWAIRTVYEQSLGAGLWVRAENPL